MSTAVHEPPCVAPHAPVDAESSKPLAPPDDDDEHPVPAAPYVILRGLAAARYNGRVGQLLHAITDVNGVDRWAVRLSETESIRVPVDNCLRLTAVEVGRWKRHVAGQGRAGTAGTAGREGREGREDREGTGEDTTPFPVALRPYVLAMDEFFYDRLPRDGGEVSFHSFATIFDEFEKALCMQVARHLADKTEDALRAALNGHMSRSDRYKEATSRYLRLVDGTLEDGESRKQVDVLRSFATAMLDTDTAPVGDVGASEEEVVCV